MKGLVFIFVFASVLAVGYGLQCYVCHPSQQSGKNCKRLEDSEARTCQSNENFCLTIDLDGEITRDCFQDTQGNKREGCRERGSTKECYCSRDLCNGATKNIGSLSVLSVSLPIIISWFLAK